MENFWASTACIGVVHNNDVCVAFNRGMKTPIKNTFGVSFKMILAEDVQPVAADGSSQKHVSLAFVNWKSQCNKMGQGICNCVPIKHAIGRFISACTPHTVMLMLSRKCANWWNRHTSVRRQRILLYSARCGISFASWYYLHKLSSYGKQDRCMCRPFRV